MQNDVVLRKISQNDKENLIVLANNKNIWDNLKDYFPYPYNNIDADFFLNLVKDENPLLTFAIEYKQQFCGVIGLVLQKDIYKRTAEIGYWIGEPYWNNGIATNAVNQITKYGLIDQDLLRIYASVIEYNKSSMRVLEKCGYNLDFIYKKSIVKNGQILHDFRYSISR